MPRARANGIEIEYEAFGDASGRPLLLIMGLGAQMIFWDVEFCEQLAASGHYVIRFDNRDVGLSTYFDKAGVPNVLQVMKDGRAGRPIEVPYTLDDMADDAAGLLAALGIERAHVCGASMGGMIAQALAIRHPQRLRSLTAIFTSTGNPELPPATPEAMAVLLEPAPAERQANIEHAVKVFRAIGGPGFPFDEERIRTRGGRLFDRAFHPEGMARHLAAIVAHGDRRPKLSGVTAPTLVIHGSADPLVPVEGGKDLAQAIAGSKLLIIDGLGHDLPPPVWPRISAAIASHTRDADARS